MIKKHVYRCPDCGKTFEIEYDENRVAANLCPGMPHGGLDLHLTCKCGGRMVEEGNHGTDDE